MVRWPGLRCGLATAVFAATVLCGTGAFADTFTIDSPLDDGDQTPGDGVCATAAGVCTLRAVIEEANTRSGVTTVDSSLRGPDTTTIVLGRALPVIHSEMWIAFRTNPFRDQPFVFVDAHNVLTGSAVLQFAVPGGRLLGLGVYDTPGALACVEATVPSSADPEPFAMTANWCGLGPDGAPRGAPGGDGLRVTTAGKNVRLDANRIGNRGGHGISVVVDAPGKSPYINLLRSYAGTDASGQNAAPTLDGLHIEVVRANGVLISAGDYEQGLVLSGNRRYGLFADLRGDATAILSANVTVGLSAPTYPPSAGTIIPNGAPDSAIRVLGGFFSLGYSAIGGNRGAGGYFEGARFYLGSSTVGGTLRAYGVSPTPWGNGGDGFVVANTPDVSVRLADFVGNGGAGLRLLNSGGEVSISRFGRTDGGAPNARNLGEGIAVAGKNGPLSIHDNEISGNGTGGVRLEGTSAAVAGNTIGCAIASGVIVGNGGDGIAVVDGDGVILGESAGNAICRSDGHGISVSATRGTRIVGNDIGYGPGNRAARNDGDGIHLMSGASATITRNRSGANLGAGLYVANAQASVSDNDFGGMSRDDRRFGNREGIRAKYSSLQFPGRPNRVFANQNAGFVELNGVVGWDAMTISGNGIGIDLGDDGPSLNDPGDADVGRLNFPLLAGVRLVDAETVEVAGFVAAGAILDLYGVLPQTPIAGGQGDVFLGRFQEGAPEDLDGATGSYVSFAGSDNDVPRFRFRVPFSTVERAGIGGITATASTVPSYYLDARISEFSPTLPLADDACLTDAACGATGWCNFERRRCAPRQPNGQPLPSDRVHTAPVLDGTCTKPAAALTCLASTCAADNRCGLRRGDLCKTNRECRSGRCDTRCYGCVADSECTGGRCGADGDCVYPPPVPDPEPQSPVADDGVEMGGGCAIGPLGDAPVSALLAVVGLGLWRRRKRENPTA